jgi:hypothetical protein
LKSKNNSVNDVNNSCNNSGKIDDYYFGNNDNVISNDNITNVNKSFEEKKNKKK